MKLSLRTALRVLLLLCIYSLSAFGAYAVFQHTKTPVTAEETTNAVTPHAFSINAGDRIDQPFTATYDTLQEVDVSLKADSSVSPDAMVTITLTQNGKVVMKQPLSASAFTGTDFFPLTVNATHCKGDSFVLSVANTSAKRNSTTAFSVMTVAKDYLFLKNTQACLVNGTFQPLRIICRFVYQDGTDFYQPLTYGFLVLLAGILLASVIWHRTASVPLKTAH